MQETQTTTAGSGPQAEPVEAAPVPAGGPREKSAAELLLLAASEDAEEDIARANWSVPWADLMMTMFVLFAALLAVQTMHQRVSKPGQQHQTPPAASSPVLEYVDRVEERIVEREKPVPEPHDVPSRKPSFEPLMRINVFERSQEAVREANLQNAEILLMDDQSVKVSVQGPMFFALGKADLRPEVTRFLDHLAQIIRQTPFEIHVVGHTDDLPISTPVFPSNWELSLVRASHVARYLIRSGALDPSRFVVMGRGEYEPAAGNGEERSRALNRRVEIIITRTITESGRPR